MLSTIVKSLLYYEFIKNYEETLNIMNRFEEKDFSKSYSFSRFNSVCNNATINSFAYQFMLEFRRIEIEEAKQKIPFIEKNIYKKISIDIFKEEFKKLEIEL